MAKKNLTRGASKAQSPANSTVPKPTDNLFQFEITLLGVKPWIWRRIQVTNCTLDQLHEHIQTSMGWTNSHLHIFVIGEQQFADPMLMEEDFEEWGCQDSTITMLSEVLPQGGKTFRFVYKYDFGDAWEHEILFEGRPKSEVNRQYPICLEGERACPPEDVGGVSGYDRFLEIIQDNRHEERKEMLKWAGGRFDAEKLGVTVSPHIGNSGQQRGLCLGRR